jgi:hypothetical protein
MSFKLFLTSILAFFPFESQLIVGESLCLGSLVCLSCSQMHWLCWRRAGMCAIGLQLMLVLLVEPFIRRLDDRLHQLALVELFMVRTAVCCVGAG